MPRVFDNFTLRFVPALQEAIAHAHHADICTGYFNLYGWKLISQPLDGWGAGQVCRIIVGMGDEKRLPQAGFDPATFVGGQLVNTQRMSQEDRVLLTHFLAQLSRGRVEVRFDRSGAEHSKVYLIYNSPTSNPNIVFAGSSNLTYSGLSGKQNNTDYEIIDPENLAGRQQWFEAKWVAALNITAELARYIQQLLTTPALNVSPTYGAVHVAPTYQPTYIGAQPAPPTPVIHRSIIRGKGVSGCISGFALIIAIPVVLALIIGLWLRDTLENGGGQQSAALSDKVALTPSVLAKAQGTATNKPTLTPRMTATAIRHMAFVHNTNAATTALRKGPTISAAKIADLQQETLVEVLPDAKVNADGFTWQRVKLTDGRTGWVIFKVLVEVSGGGGS